MNHVYLCVHHDNNDPNFYGSMLSAVPYRTEEQALDWLGNQARNYMTTLGLKPFVAHEVTYGLNSSVAEEWWLEIPGHDNLQVRVLKMFLYPVGSVTQL